MSYNVVVNYSWEDLARTEDGFVNLEDAIQDLRNQWSAEVEEDKANGRDFESYINEAGTYAKIVNHRANGDTDITEYRIAQSF